MKPRTTYEKRRKENARKERKQDKAERRKQRQEERASRPDATPDGVDPDIAHVVWGPQPEAQEEYEVERPLPGLMPLEPKDSED